MKTIGTEHGWVTITSHALAITVSLSANPAHLSPQEARDLARALLDAVDAADAAGEDDG